MRYTPSNVKVMHILAHPVMLIHMIEFMFSQA